MTGFVYAIATDNGRVKIGWSADPLRRLSKIRSDCPAMATLLGVVPASREQEAELQSLLAPWRVHGEWFVRSGPVDAFLAALPPPVPRQVAWAWKAKRTDHPLARWIDARMTRSEFAKQAGIRPPHLSGILRRTRFASLELAARISRLTDGAVPIDLFVKETESAPKDPAANSRQGVA